MPEKSLTVTQSSERLGVAISTIHDWIREGVLPGARQLRPVKNSPWQIPESDIIAIEKQRTAQSQSVTKKAE